MGIYIVLAAALVPLILLYLLWKYTYWYRQGVAQGNLLEMFSGEVDLLMPGVSYWDLYLRMARKYSDKPFYGLYNMTKPSLAVKDAEIVKDILLRKFSSFKRNGLEIDEDVHPILARDPFFAPSVERWRETRTQFTSLMTPGRLRAMFPDMVEVAKETLKYLKDLKHESGKGDGVDVKDVTLRYMTNLLIRHTLSLNADCFNDKKSVFFEKTKSLFDTSDDSYFSMLFTMVAPNLGAYLGLSFPPKGVTDFFSNVIRQQKEYRLKSGTPRNDILDTMLKRTSESDKPQNNTNGSKEAKKEKDEVEADILAMIVMFVLEGFETTSTNISTCAVELARNPEIQDNLRQQTLTDCPLGTELTEEALNNATLLQNCLLESLRLYPPGIFTQRMVTEDVTLQAKTGEKISLKKGAFVNIPIAANHRDPEHFPEPEKFDPDRFEDEMQKRLFLSFGDGPRQCPGQRFATLAAKVLVATLIREFQVELSPKTKIPLETNNHLVLFSPKSAWVRFVSL